MTQSFPIVPAATSWLWILALVVALGLLPVVVVGRSMVAGYRARFDVTPEGLELRGDWWGRTVPRASLRLDEARVVDLAREDSLARRAIRTGSSRR